MFGIQTTKTRDLYERRPTGPLTPNYGSWQIHNLLLWLPAAPFNNSLAVNYATGGGSSNFTNNSATYVQDPYGLMGQAWLFDDAATNYLGLAAAVTTAITGITFTTWFNVNDTAVEHVLIDSHVSGSAAFRNSRQMRAQASGDGLHVSAVACDNSGFTTANSTNAFAINTWSHGCVSFTSATLRAAYCQGTGKGTSVTSRTITGTINQTAVGRCGGSAPANYLSGMISDARIYGRVLNDIEVYQLWSPETRWQAYYPLGKIVYSFFLGIAPTVTTSAVTDITSTTATGNGEVTDDGGNAVTERGVCWDTATGPTTANSKAAAAAGGEGVFTASMTSLSASTHYYVRAYAINSLGTSYGSEVEFDSAPSAGGFIPAWGAGANVLIQPGVAGAM